MTSLRFTFKAGLARALIPPGSVTVKKQALPASSAQTPLASNIPRYVRAVGELLLRPEAEAELPVPQVDEPASDQAAWLGEVYSLVAHGRIDAAIDIVFREFDSLFLRGRFDTSDGILRTIDLKRMDSNLTVAVLSVTLPAKSRLPNRARFLARAEARLSRVAPGRVERLLAGLR